MRLVDLHRTTLEQWRQDGFEGTRWEEMQNWDHAPRSWHESPAEKSTSATLLVKKHEEKKKEEKRRKSTR